MRNRVVSFRSKVASARRPASTQHSYTSKRNRQQSDRHSAPWIGWKVLALLAHHRLTVACLSLLILVAAALDLAIPFVTRTLIDQIIHALGGSHQGSFRILIGAAAAIFCATVLTRLLRSFYNYRLFRTVSQCEDEVKNAAFANYLSLDTEYHLASNTGEVVGALDRGGSRFWPRISKSTTKM